MKNSWKGKSATEWSDEELQAWIRWRDRKAWIGGILHSLLLLLGFGTFLLWYWFVFLDPILNH